MAEPRVTGSLQVRRGNFELLGQRFELRVGHDPVHRRHAAQPDDRRSGGDAAPATSPPWSGSRARRGAPSSSSTASRACPRTRSCRGSCSSARPADSVPAQAIQLAAAVNTLRGGGLGVLGQARQALGLDTLDVSGEGLQDGRVRAGRYLNDNVYRRGRQGHRGRQRGRQARGRDPAERVARRRHGCAGAKRRRPQVAVRLLRSADPIERRGAVPDAGPEPLDFDLRHAVRPQPDRPVDALPQGGAALPQGPRADARGAGRDHADVPPDLHARARAQRADDRGPAVPAVPGARA